jgi:hypothetical protein
MSTVAASKYEKPREQYGHPSTDACQDMCVQRQPSR